MFKKNANHAVPVYLLIIFIELSEISKKPYAMMFTLFPPARLAICTPSAFALSSIEPEGGTDAVITSIPFAANAFVIPRQ